MYKRFNSVLIILTLVVVSCKNQNNENTLNESDSVVFEEIRENDINQSEIEKSNFSKLIQGKWRENTYPYRTAEFLNSTVKFVEEGMANDPKFEKYEFGQDCRFDNNNIKDLRSGDIILILPENSRCEKIKVSNDTLILSGYSTNTNKNYNIIYLRFKG